MSTDRPVGGGLCFCDTTSLASNPNHFHSFWRPEYLEPFFITSATPAIRAKLNFCIHQPCSRSKYQPSKKTSIFEKETNSI
jgi:hypothetical protein